ncbi:MAG: hypothetical protein ABI844_03355 [Saprospiraceae bacterium]
MSVSSKAFHSFLLVHIFVFIFSSLLAQPVTIKDVSPTADNFPIANSVNHSASGKIFNIAGSADGTRLYAGTQAGIWRSDDSGANWLQLTRPQPSENSFNVPGALPASYINDIIVSPVNPDLVFAIAYENARISSVDGVYRSKNGGQTWQLIKPMNNGLGQIIFSPDDPNLLFIAAGSKIYRSKNAGETWDEKNTPVSVYHVASSEVVNNRRHVYALGQGVMMVSQNGGDTWFRDMSTTVPDFIGGPVADHSSNGAQIMVVVPNQINQVIVSSPTWANGPSYWRNNPLLDGDGAKCNTNLIYDANDNKLLDSAEIIIFGLSQNAVAGLVNEPKIKYIDINNNSIWDMSETIIYDADQNNIYNKSIDIKYSGEPAENSPLSTDLKIRAVNTGKPFGIPCSDGSIWFGGYNAFDTSSINTRKSTWLPLQGPAVYRMTNSGNSYLNVVKTNDNFLLFFSDKNHVHVCKGFPLFSSDWHCLNAKDASAAKLANETGAKRFVHDDPHGIYISRDFNIHLIAPTGVSSPYNQNKVLGQYISGKIYMANDGGVYRSLDGGASWILGKGLSSLGPINVGLLAKPGKKPALYFGAGDDDDFFTTDGGDSWQDPLSGCGDCDMWYADIAIPSKMASFQPRGAGLDIYTDASNFPNAQNGAIRKQIKVEKGRSNLVSFYAIKGYRPIIQTLSNEIPPADLDFVMIRLNAQNKRVLLRAPEVTNITEDSDWFNTALASEVGPELPFASAPKCGDNLLCSPVVQTAGGHRDPTFFVSLPGTADTIWKWKNGMKNWTPIYPNNDRTAGRLIRFFVNPFNPNLMYVIDLSGIRRSDNGGASWVLDNILDSLVSENKTFKYNGDNSLIQDIAFSRDQPNIRFVIANSGVYMATNNFDWRRLMNSTAMPSNPFAGSFDDISDQCDRSLYVATNGRGILKFGNIPEAVKKVDVTAITGKKISKYTTSWQTKNGPFTVEHVAGVSPEGDLIANWWSPQHDWLAVNIFELTRMKLAPNSKLTSWQTKNGQFNVEHLAGLAPNGDLITFWWSPQHNWKATNVSQKAGKQLYPDSGITSWQSKNGPFNVEHLAGVNKSGELINFWWSPQHDWQMVNVSQKAGMVLHSAANITSWQTKNGPFNVEHLAGINSQGDLINFWWSPQHDWQKINVSQIAGKKLHLLSSVSNWQSPNGLFNVEHLAGATVEGDIIVFWWSLQHDWQWVNVSQKAHEKINPEAGISWQTDFCNRIDHISSVNQNGELISFWWTPASDWRAGNLSGASQQNLNHVSSIWQTKNGQYNVEHLAGVFDSNLIVTYTRNSAFD